MELRELGELGELGGGGGMTPMLGVPPSAKENERSGRRQKEQEGLQGSKSVHGGAGAEEAGDG